MSATGVVDSATCPNQSIKLSSGTVLQYFKGAATPPTNYLILAYNTQGNGAITGSNLSYYCYSSVAGGSITTKTTTAPTAYGASC